MKRVILQILKNNEDIALKIFDYEVGQIDMSNSFTQRGPSQAPKRIIHLNTLTEFADVSDDFKPIFIEHGYQGVGGYISLKYITYSLEKILFRIKKSMF